MTVPPLYTNVEKPNMIRSRSKVGGKILFSPSVRFVFQTPVVLNPRVDSRRLRFDVLPESKFAEWIARLASGVSKQCSSKMDEYPGVSHSMHPPLGSTEKTEGGMVLAPMRVHVPHDVIVSKRVEESGQTLAPRVDIRELKGCNKATLVLELNGVQANPDTGHMRMAWTVLNIQMFTTEYDLMSPHTFVYDIEDDEATLAGASDLDSDSDADNRSEVTFSRSVPASGVDVTFAGSVSCDPNDEITPYPYKDGEVVSCDETDVASEV